MTLATLTFLTLLSLAPVMGRWSALNPGGTWQQEIGVGGGERDGRKDARENEVYQEGVVEDDDDDVDGGEYGGARGLTARAVVMEVARHVLRLLHQHRQQEGRMGREAMTSAIARDTVRLIVMGLMGYHGEEECTHRVACEAGGVLARFYPGASLILGALDMVAPLHLSTVTRLAKEASMGRSCVTFRCGDAYYPPDNEVRP